MGRPVLFAALAMMFWLGTAPAQAQKNKRNKEEATLQAEEVFLDGVRADMLGNTEKAIYYYEKALEADPNASGIYFKIAEMQARQGRYKDAQYFGQRALDLDPSNIYYQKMLGALFSRNNEHEEAIKLYQKALKTNADEPDFYQLLALEQLRASKPNDALKTLDKAEKQLGPAPELARERQQIYLKQNKLDDALREARKLVAVNPDEPEYVLNLAELLISNNHGTEAGKLLNDHKAMLNGMPGYDLMQLQVAAKNGDKEAAKKYMLAALGSTEMDLDDKLTYLAPYLRAETDSADVPAMLDALMSAHRDQAKVYFLRGDYEGGRSHYLDARTAYMHGLLLDKNNFAVWEQVARLDLELQQPDSLIAHTDAAKELFPSAAVLWFYNGWGLFMKKENPKAIRSLERARKLKPANAAMEKEVFALLGDLYNTQKDFDKSDDAYSQALKLDSLDAHVLNNYSYYLSLREAHLDLAARLGAKLMMVAPNESTYQDTYGWVLFKKGDFAEALKYLEKACAGNEPSGVVWEHYGDALYKNGKTQKALEVWKQAQRKGGDVTPKLTEKINQGRYID